MLLRARRVLPLSRPPIDDGAVVVREGRIAEVGSWRDLRTRAAPTETLDLGERILLPGLINTHCHLDYTDMGGQLAPTRHFSDWIKSILALKATWGYSEFAQSWLHGSQMLLRTGCTTVLDVEAVPELLPDTWQATPLRVISCLELISIRRQLSVPRKIAEASQFLAGLPLAQNRVGLSPHACYTTSPELLGCAAQAAREHGWLLTTHVAESKEEYAMFVNRRGPLFEWLKKQRDMSDCGVGSPVQLLEKAGALSERFVAVHVNYASAGDIETLARHRASVVHCPRSHAYFQHRSFPLDRFGKAGVRVCLGTDSLATVLKTRRHPLELNLFSELQSLAAKAGHLPPERLLQMVTLHAAAALGRTGELGELRPGAQADLIALPARGESQDPYETVLHHRGDVDASMIGGRWVIQPSEHA